MAKVTNLDDLKRMHDLARIAKPGSKEWIDFAATMIDSFPSLYKTAMAMNERMAKLEGAMANLIIEAHNVKVRGAALLQRPS